MPQTTHRPHRLYLVLIALYVAQSIPMSFFTAAVPAIMRQEGYSLASIGLLQMVKLPWIFKLLWAPLVDSHAHTPTALRRCIIGAEVFYACILVCIGFFNLQTNLPLIAGLIIIAIVASATQDICTDALSIRALSTGHHGMGAGMQSMGGFIGSLVGGGVLLMVYQVLGWQSLVGSLALLVLVALVPLLFWGPKTDAESLETATPESPESATRPRVRPADVVRYFRRPGIGKHIVFLLLHSTPLMPALAMMRPYLIDLGQSIEQVGVTMGLMGTSVAALSSLAAGMLMHRLGKRRCLVPCSLVVLAAVAFAFAVSLWGHASIGLARAACLGIWLAHGFATVTVYGFAMGRVRQGCAGTDFTLQTTLTQLGALLLSVLAGFVAGSFGYSVLFAAATLLGGVALIYNVSIYKPHIASL